MRALERAFEHAALLHCTMRLRARARVSARSAPLERKFCALERAIRSVSARSSAQ